MCEYGFTENEDYVKVTQKCLTSSTGQNMTDHQLTIEIAKEICIKNKFTIDFDWIYGIIYLEGNFFKCLSLVDMRLIK